MASDAAQDVTQPTPRFEIVFTASGTVGRGTADHTPQDEQEDQT